MSILPGGKPQSWRCSIRKGRKNRIGRAGDREDTLRLLSRCGYHVGFLSAPLVLDPLFFAFRIYPFYDGFSYPHGRARIYANSDETEVPDDTFSVNVNWIFPHGGESMITGYRLAEDLAEKLSVCTGTEWGDVALMREIELFREFLSIYSSGCEEESNSRAKGGNNLKSLWSYPPDVRMVWVKQKGGLTDVWPFDRYGKGYPFHDEVRKAQKVSDLLKNPRSSFRNHPLFLMGEMISLYCEVTAS